MEEIEIMELIGATKAFIKIPFMIEGMFQGLIGSSVSILILFISFKYIETKLFSPLVSFFGSTGFRFVPFSYLLCFIFGGLLLGTLGGIFASGKTLKVDSINSEE